jgi:hypothetical protein
MAEGAGVWLATDYDWNVDTFDPDPAGAPSLDLDDKLILQKGGGMGEGSYNLPSSPPAPGANHAVWFDRDGVDQWQAAMWGAIDGVTYNTGGTYDIVITLHADSASSGTAYMTINGESQGFYDPGWHSGPADLMPAGMTFTGDMTRMQVFYGMYGYGATHTVVFEDISADGVLSLNQLECDEQVIDIKPGSDPNCFNNDDHGVIPVAIFGSASFDATQIDPASVTLGSLSVKAVGKGNKFLASIEDVDGDGILDMVVKIQDADGAFTSGSGTADITGFLNDGTFFWGTDSICVVP